MVDKFLVLVRCSTYNHASFITETMDGFINQQTNFPFVCAIIDDASVDGEPEILKRFFVNNFDVFNQEVFRHEETDSYIMSFAQHKANRNCYFAVFLLKYNHYQIKKNKLDYLDVLFNKSKYCAICEGDDYWISPLKLQKQVDYMEKHPDCSLVFHNAYIKSEDSGNIIGIHKISNKSENISFRKIVRDGGLIPSLSIMHRLDVFKNFSAFPSNCPVGDLRLQTYAVMVGNVYYENEIMGVYRLVNTSRTHVIKKNTDRFVTHHKKFIEWYKSINEYTGYKYNKEIKGAIAFSEARIAIAEDKCHKLWNPKYYRYIWNEPISSRAGLLLRMLGLNNIYLKFHDYRARKREKR